MLTLQLHLLPILVARMLMVHLRAPHVLGAIAAPIYYAYVKKECRTEG